MSGAETVTAKIADVRRMGVSGYGNPTYRVYATDGRTWVTGIDSQVGYEIGNFKPSLASVKAGTQPTVRLTLERGRVIGVDELPQVPEDFPVRVLASTDRAGLRVTCGECLRVWDDAVVTQWTPTPAARCPFENWH